MLNIALPLKNPPKLLIFKLPLLWSPYISPVSFLPCPVSQWILQKSHSILLTLHGHRMVLPPSLCTAWCHTPSPPHQEASPCPEELKTHLSPVFPSPSGGPCVSLFCSTPALPANPLGQSLPFTILYSHLALARDSKPAWDKCPVYQLSYRKEQFSEEMKSPLSIHKLWK